MKSEAPTKIHLIHPKVATMQIICPYFLPKNPVHVVSDAFPACTVVTQADRVVAMLSAGIVVSSVLILNEKFNENYIVF